MIGRHTKAGRGPGVPAEYPIREGQFTVRSGISLAAHRNLRRYAALGAADRPASVPHSPAGGISLPDSSRLASIQFRQKCREAPAGLTRSRGLGRLVAIRKCDAEVARWPSDLSPSHSGGRAAINLLSVRAKSALWIAPELRP